jgi:ubiquinone/menaquinone biosynthesis C-methylase UbiE
MKQNNSKKIVRLQFDRQAEKFSNWSVTKNEEYASYYYDFCRMTGEDRLLDVSCGSGDFCFFCAQNISHATGFDLSDNMIALAKQQAQTFGITNTTFRRGDAVNLPNESGIFTIVVSKSAFHHYSEHDSIFKEMKRCCSQQGRISIQDIVAYDDKHVNDFFESFEQMVDASHKVTCSKSFILDMYQQHNVKILSTMEVAIDLNLEDYLNHAVRSDKDTVRLRQLIEAGLKDDKIKDHFLYQENDLCFKRNVFLVLGQKEIL